MDLNEVTLIGNVVQDPRRRDLPSGDVTANFSVATNYQWRDPATKEQHRSVDYHDIVAWGKLAEIAGRYLQQGTKVWIRGRLKNREFNAKDGTKVRKAEIALVRLNILSPKGEPAAGEATSDETLAELEAPEQTHPAGAETEPSAAGS